MPIYSCFVCSSIIGLVKFQLVHLENFFLLILIQVRQIFGYHQSSVFRLVVNIFFIENKTKIELIFLGKKSKYDSSRSSTSRSNGAIFRINYADGSYANGAFINDTITVSY